MLIIYEITSRSFPSGEYFYSIFLNFFPAHFSKS